MEDNRINKPQVMQDFDEGDKIIGDQTIKFLKLVYPSYLVNKDDDIETWLDSNSSLRIRSMSFFRISSCTADNVDDIFENVNERFEKLFTALYSVDIPIAYGLVSFDGITSLVIGVYQSAHAECVKTMIQGMLSGIEMKPISSENFLKENAQRSYGLLTGVPSLLVKDKKQAFSLSSIMRGLNGQNYTLLFIAKPVKQEIISQNIGNLISVRDTAFAVSKRNVAFSKSHSETDSWNRSRTVDAIKWENKGKEYFGELGAFIGGCLGNLIGQIRGSGNISKEFSLAISKASSDGNTVSADIQNGFALELMNYANSAIERLKGGQNSGMWQTAIAYSAETEMARNIIRACLNGELSKLDAERLPMLAFEPKVSAEEILRIPDFLESGKENPLCTYLNSSELGLLCTVPTESVPDFELRREKKLPLIASRLEADTIQIGNVVDGGRILQNMPFALCEQDLNKHTFVCGITGSGKTTTVKKILLEAKKPFLVIESAKKEYRNIGIENTVYTPGNLGINAPQMNPFYILPGVNPLLHIDFLKDLFNASFSFYGPMPYILEKCLHSVYRNKGWDLTWGYHPFLANTKSLNNFFDKDYIESQYKKISHKFLFPTMQELKDEIARYVEEELKYDGEVAGNIKTAMKVRLENLCSGAKGYTFNTNEFIDFDELLGKNTIFELEGLADDADKAFCVGLLVIFINEYRQIQKERDESKKMGLQHLLVIEEAHRLLKNIDTERSTETMGNPKGKAVEHFTNMIAEMRSYGQGVIVAEQIPTKLAPDVIKNSSTKIIQRVVSIDDQQIIANTIGLKGEDAIQLGTLKTGYAYCHKEGMVLPTPVKILDKFMDRFVNDEILYHKMLEEDNKAKKINLSILHNCLGGEKRIKRKAFAFLNTLMIEDEAACIAASEALMNLVENEIKRNDIYLIGAKDNASIAAEFLAEVILSIMTRGVYCSKALPKDEFISLLKSSLWVMTSEKIAEIKRELKSLYSKDLAGYAKINIAALIRRSLKQNTDIPSTIRQYFIEVSDSTVDKIVEMVKGGEAS